MADPYSMPPPPPPLPYNPANPYSTTGTVPYASVPPVPPAAPPYIFPPPARPAKRGNKVLLIVVGVLLVLMFACGATVFVGATLVGVGIQQVSKHITPVPSDEQATVAPTSSVDQDSYLSQPGTLVMNDPMHDSSKGYKWDEATMNEKNSNASCGYTSGNYHIARGTRGSLICNPEAPSLTFANLTFEATMTIVKGSEAGIAARFDQVKGVGYAFIITSDGHYVIDTVDFNNKDPNKQFAVLRQGSNSAIKQGLNQSNTVAFIINGNTISTFVNHQFIDRAVDSSFTNGQLGVYGFGDPGEDVIVQNVRAWRI